MVILLTDNEISKNTALQPHSGLQELRINWMDKAGL